MIVALTAWATTCRLYADDLTAVSLTVRSSGCSTQQPTELQLVEALRLELLDDGVTQVKGGPRSDGASIAIAQACVGAELRVVVEVRLLGGSEPVTQALSLTPVPETLRARSVALACSELLRGLRAAAPARAKQRQPARSRRRRPGHPERAATLHASTVNAPREGASTGAPLTAASAAATPLSAAPSTSPPPAASDVDAAQPSEAAEKPPALQRSGSAKVSADIVPSTLSLALGPALRMIGAQYTALYGGELSLRWDRFELAATGLWGSQHDSLGDARYSFLGGSLAFAALRAVWNAWFLSAGLRAGLAAVSASARANVTALANTGIVASSASVAGQFMIALALGRRWQLQLQLQGGYASGPRLTADTRTLATLSGFYTSVCFSGAFALKP